MRNCSVVGQLGLVFILTFATILTVAAVASIFHLWYPAVPVAAALALGAVVAPPDPVAVSALADRLGLPRRLMSVLEGEGLFNDVTAVVLYNVAVQAGSSSPRCSRPPVRTGRGCSAVRASSSPSWWACA
jgi:NhaP-type Na+/H+ or K+/H+ antiporter